MLFRPTSPRRQWRLASHPKVLLAAYGVAVFFVIFADAIMSYLSPVIIESTLNSAFLMGVILSSSSLAGIITDIIFGSRFAGRSYSFFLSWGIVTAVLFPAILLIFPHTPLIFLITMAIWGIYYELIHFSHFQFINHALPHSQHALGWGVMNAFSTTAYLIGPIVASLLLQQNFQIPLITVIGFQLVSVIAVVMFLHSRSKHVHAVIDKPTKISLMTEMKMWLLLSKKIWPLLLFLITIYLIDSAFWTVGVLMSEAMSQIIPIAGSVLFIYMLPGLFVGFFVDKIAKPSGKKRAALVTGVISGLAFTAAGLLVSPYLFLFFTFIASLFMALAVPEIMGTIEDYVERLGDKGNVMVGLESSATSAAYIAGPIISGSLASLVGFGMTFAILGGLLTLVSLVCLFVIPRKIHLPQEVIKNL